MSVMREFIRAVFHPHEVRQIPADAIALQEGLQRMQASTKRLSRAIEERDGFGAMVARMKGGRPKPKRNGK